MEQLDRIANPAYVADLTERPLEDIRAMRTECQEIENALSYVRRMVQGRLDIVGGEFKHRREGGSGGDVHDLLHRLPEFLIDGGGNRSSGTPRPPQSDVSSADVIGHFEAGLERVMPASDLSRLAERDDNQLARMVEALEDFENDVSQRRHDLHTRIDQLQAEITRRYRSGEASVDTLLS